MATARLDEDPEAEVVSLWVPLEAPPGFPLEYGRAEDPFQHRPAVRDFDLVAVEPVGSPLAYVKRAPLLYLALQDGAHFWRPCAYWARERVVLGGLEEVPV